MKTVTIETIFHLIYANLKAVLCFSLVALTVALMTFYGTSQVLAAGPDDTAIRPPFKAGTLLKGQNHAHYYVTESGTRYFIYDADTFLAFGFEHEDVIQLNDDILTEMPLTDILTRLVMDDEDNLYWVVNGRRWQVNEWKDIVLQSDYHDGTIGHLDSALGYALPMRLGLKNNSYLRQDGDLYYFNQGSIIPLPQANYDDAEIIDVPSQVLTLYPQKSTLDILLSQLKDTPAAYMRTGPDTDFEAIKTVYKNSTIIIKGRAQNSHWLQIKYQGRVGWLAGDLVKHQALFKFLPTIDTSNLQPQQKQPQNNSPRTYEGVGGWMSTNQDNTPIFSEVMKGYPAHLAGIKGGDVVLKIDGQDATNLSVHEAVTRIRGQKGSEVLLTIFRPETNETLEFVIIRATISPDTATAVCGTEPIRGFGTAWRNHPEIQDALGCPFLNFRRDEHATPAAVQTFEHGWMLWLETDTVANVDPIYVFYEDDASYIRFGDRQLVDAHSYAPTPAGFYKVGDRFAKVYWEEIGAEGRQRLGQATNEARDTLGAFQEFRNGRMFWAGEADTIYIIYSGYLDLDGDGRTSWTKEWTSFEDTFEAGSNE